MTLVTAAPDNPFAPELLLDTDLLDGADTGVRIVTLNRPDALNATNEALHRALIRVWRHLAADPAVRAVVITGAGRAFSAGGDMQHFVELWDDHAQRRREIDGARHLLTELVDFPLPLVAAVNGPAVGLGCTIAASCDIVLIAESAFIADPHVGVGLTAADGGAPLWPLLTGMLRAKEYLLTGARIPASVAVEIGLATRTVADGTSVDEAVAVARTLAAAPPQAVRSTKQALNIHMKKAIAGVLEFALAEEYQSFDQPEHQELVRAFLARAAKNG